MSEKEKDQPESGSKLSSVLGNWPIEMRRLSYSFRLTPFLPMVYLGNLVQCLKGLWSIFIPICVNEHSKRRNSAFSEVFHVLKGQARFQKIQPMV